MEEDTCYDCGCAVGEFHTPGCDMEICPFCKGQAISCNCAYEKLGLLDSNGHITEPYYSQGLDDKAKEWDEILRKKGLIPYSGHTDCAMSSTPEPYWPEPGETLDADRALDDLRELHGSGGPKDFERAINLIMALDIHMQNGRELPKTWRKEGE